MVQEVNQLYRRTWDRNSKELEEILLKTKCWTDSDKAFAITLLVNNLEVWREKHRDPLHRTAKTRFTKTDPSNGKKRATHTWTNEGVQYYNDTLQRIIDLKKESVGFDLDLLKSLRNSKKRKHHLAEDRVVPLIDPAIMAML